MLKGKNVVIIKGDKDTPTVVHEYDRVYLEFSPVDPTESFTKTSEGKDLTVSGKVWEGIRPKDKVSTAPVQELVAQALAYFGETYPKANPYNTLLEAASYGADLWTRNTIQADLRPSKPVDKQAIIEKQVKLLMQMAPKKYPTRESALAKAMALAEENE